MCGEEIKTWIDPPPPKSQYFRKGSGVHNGVCCIVVIHMFIKLPLDPPP